MKSPTKQEESVFQIKRAKSGVNLVRLRTSAPLLKQALSLSLYPLLSHVLFSNLLYAFTKNL